MAYRRCVRAALLSIVALLFPGLPALHAELTQEQVTAAKAATGLLVTSMGTGSAFCISESGLFITCDHMIGDSKEDKLAIVMSPAGKDEKRYPARIVRRLKDADLAILKVDLDRQVPALKLGDDTGLFETEQLYAFGYPFGKALAVDEKSYPAISVNLGRITSLRNKNDVLEVIQLDAQVNPGNSGGPALDPNGNVVGVISSGLVASGVNFAIPIALLSKAMATPIIGIAAPKADPEHLSKPVEFAVSVDWVVPPAPEPKIFVEIRGEGPSRRVEAQKGKDGKSRAQIVPGKEPDKTQKAKLQITLDFESGKIAGAVVDRDISIAGKPKALGAIHTLDRTSDNSKFQADGKPAGTLPELEALTLDIGGATVTVDARKATKIEIQKPPILLPVIYYKAVVALADGKEFSSEEKAFTMSSGAPVPPPVIRGKVDLTGVREISLPSPISDVAAAQDARSLLLHLKELKKLAVFDVIDLKIRGYIDLDEDKALFAGGSRYVLVACPGENLIQRYSVETLQKERTIANSFGDIASITMGRSSPGLALIVSSGDSRSTSNIMAFDAESMTVVSTLDANTARQMNNSRAIVRSSADGRTFGFCKIGSSPTGFTVLTFRDNEFTRFYQHATCGVLVPNADGTQIFTSQSGVYTNQFVSLVEGGGNWSEGTSFLPSYHPMYFLSVPYSSDNFGGDKKKKPKTMGIYLTGSSQALVQAPEELKEMHPGTKGPDGRISADPMTLDKRYHFFPQMDLLLTIPPANDKIVARSLNVRHLLDEKGIDYLYVTSVAPLGRVSTPYRYRLEAASKAGNVKFTLQSGPKGLAVGGDGDVTWNAPSRPVDETVIVSLKAASGQEAFHTFRVVITK